MFDTQEAAPAPTLEPAIFDQLQQTLEKQGALPAIEQLCAELKDLGDYHALFYALLMKKRVELGVSPFPTGPASDLPVETHEAYENAIREAGRYVGKLYLDQGDVRKAWFFFQMLGEPEPVREFIEHYAFDQDADPSPIIEVGLYQGVHPTRGFQLALQRYGICSAITIYSSQDFSRFPAAKQACIGMLVEALHAQLSERLRNDIHSHGEAVSEDATITEMLNGRDYLTADDAYHIDTSHLASIAQMSLELEAGPAVLKARELCAYGEKLSTHFKQENDPPFENSYSDYRVLLEIVDGVRVAEGLAHFRNKIEPALADGLTLPAEVYVNLLLRLGRKDEAREMAKKYLSGENRQLVCPGVYELCQQAKDYAGLADAARKRADGVSFLASLICGRQ